MEPRVTIVLTVGQAYALRDALDAYSRLCMGQLEEIAGLVRQGVIPARTANPADVADHTESLMKQAKSLLGHPSSGSYGIGNPNVSLSGRRAYELQKTVDKVLAIHRDPAPGIRGVNYDGLTVRYTDDPAPACVLHMKCR